MTVRIISGIFGGGNLRHALNERKDDLYETPEVAVESLLRVEPLPRVLWEPACGPGAIVRVLRRRGHSVHATDLVDYESPDQDESGWDFLLEQKLPAGVEAIVTNPPYKNAGAFVAHALRLCPKVVMLLRLQFLEAGNKKTEAGRARLLALDGGSLARVHVFRNRVPMMHRDGWKGPKISSTMAFAWFVWDSAWSGPTVLHRISCEAA
jgi:hypothetical protein